MFSGSTVPRGSKETVLGISDRETSPSAGKDTGVVFVSCSRMEVRPNSHFRLCKDWCQMHHLLSVVSDAFEKLVNNSIVDHLEKCGLFSNFWYGFRSSRSTADPLIADKLLGLLTGLGLLVL